MGYSFKSVYKELIIVEYLHYALEVMTGSHVFT